MILYICLGIFTLVYYKTFRVQGYPAVSTRGPVCFDCQQVSNPMLCDKIRVCETNQVNK